MSIKVTEKNLVVCPICLKTFVFLPGISAYVVCSECTDKDEYMDLLINGNPAAPRPQGVIDMRETTRE